MSGPELSNIKLHLMLYRKSSLPSRLSLVFSPRISGNRPLYLIFNEKSLHYQRWEEDIGESPYEQIDVGPIVAIVRLIKKAYRDVPFLKEAARTIFHTKRTDLSQDQFFELARTIEDLATDEPVFKNAIVRDC